MRKIIFLIVITFCASTISSAQSHGTAVYEIIISDSAQQAQVADQMPDDEALQAVLLSALRQRPPRQKVLYFDSLASQYIDYQEANTDPTGSNNIQVVSESSSRYRHAADQQSITQKTIFSKPFLIEEQAERIAWKLTNNTKQVGSYTAHQATATVDGQPVEAWFIYEVPVSTGPDVYWGLPGLILEVQEPKSGTTIALKSLSSNSPSEEQLAAPRRGKKVSWEEFYAIQDKKIKELESTSSQF